MTKRINIALPCETTEVILTQQIKAGAKANAQRDLDIVSDWFFIDEEASRMVKAGTAGIPGARGHSRYPPQAQWRNAVTDNQQFVAAISATLVPSFAVLVGILMNNARLNDVISRLSDLRFDVLGRIGDLRADMNQRFAAVDQRFVRVEARLDLTLSRLGTRKTG
jgi:hypothetical protein